MINDRLSRVNKTGFTSPKSAINNRLIEKISGHPSFNHIEKVQKYIENCSYVTLVTPSCNTFRYDLQGMNISVQLFLGTVDIKIDVSDKNELTRERCGLEWEVLRQKIHEN